jgi:hypothetical protein
MSVHLTSPGTVARQSVTPPASYRDRGPPIKSLKPRRSKASSPSFGQITVQPVPPMGHPPYPRNTVRSSSSPPRSASGSVESISIGLRIARDHLRLARPRGRSSPSPSRSASGSLETISVSFDLGFARVRLRLDRPPDRSSSSPPRSASVLLEPISASIGLRFARPRSTSPGLPVFPLCFGTGDQGLE